MTAPRNAPAPSADAEGEAKSFGGDRVQYPVPVNPPDWGATIDCPLACGLRWCPWECPKAVEP